MLLVLIVVIKIKCVQNNLSESNSKRLDLHFNMFPLHNNINGIFYVTFLSIIKSSKMPLISFAIFISSCWGEKVVWCEGEQVIDE